MRTFYDARVGDVIVACDEYSHDYHEHLVKVDEIEYDTEYRTATNPEGMICRGTDIDESEWGDDYITLVHEGNFICFAEDKDRLEI